jgi:hypothetical protein
LEAAVPLLQKLFERENRSAVPIEEAVQAWGHENLSGPSRVRLAALRQYGLLDTVQGGKVRVSDLGLTLCIMPPDSSEYGQALAQAALSPTLFEEIWETMRDAGDGNLRHTLMRERGFSMEGATKVVKSFRGTVSFARLGKESYDGEAQQDDDEVTTMPLLQNPPDTRVRQPISVAPPTLPTHIPALKFRLSDTLGAGITFDGTFSAEDLDMLRDLLEVQGKVLRRRSPETPPTISDYVAPTYQPSGQLPEPGMVSFSHTNDDDHS